MTDVRLEHRQLLQQLFSWLLLFLYIYVRDKLRRLSNSYVVVKIDEIILLTHSLIYAPHSFETLSLYKLLTYILTYLIVKNLLKF